MSELTPAYDPPPGLVAVGSRVEVELISRDGHSYRVKGQGTPDQVGKLVFAAAKESGTQVRGYSPASRSLEEAFLEAIR